MKNRPVLMGISAIVLVFGLVFVGCPADTGIGNPDTSIDTVDSAFWFGEVYVSLIERIGEQSGETYVGKTGENMGQVANTQYICNAINAKWGKIYTPVVGTANQAANCEYLLKMVDKANGANGNSTSYGTGSYATKQVVDTIAVNDAVNRLIVGKFVAVANDSNKAAYSTDGINWTAAALPNSAGWYNVTYGNGKFVTVVRGSNKAAYSTNGINWTEVTLPSSAFWQGVTVAKANQ